MKLETTFHILKLPTIEFFQTLLYGFFLSKSSIQHMSLNFLMGSAETGNKTSASKLQVGSKHSHNVFQIIKLEAKVPDHFHISFRVFWLLLFNIQNMCERRIKIILERFETKICVKIVQCYILDHFGSERSGKALWFFLKRN